MLSSKDKEKKKHCEEVTQNLNLVSKFLLNASLLIHKHVSFLKHMVFILIAVCDIITKNLLENVLPAPNLILLFHKQSKLGVNMVIFHSAVKDSLFETVLFIGGGSDIRAKMDQPQ